MQDTRLTLAAEDKREGHQVLWHYVGVAVSGLRVPGLCNNDPLYGRGRRANCSLPNFTGSWKNAWWRDTQAPRKPAMVGLGYRDSIKIGHGDSPRVQNANFGAASQCPICRCLRYTAYLNICSPLF